MALSISFGALTAFNTEHNIYRKRV